MKILAALAVAAYLVRCLRRLPPPQPEWFDALDDTEFFERVNDSGEFVP